MALKKLNQFSHFDCELFFKDKKLVVTATGPWKDFETEKVLGTKIAVTIISDKTEYKVEDGEAVTNLYEKLVVKVPGTVDIPLEAEVRLVNPVGTVYGDYRNQLSIRADGVEVVAPVKLNLNKQ